MKAIFSMYVENLQVGHKIVFVPRPGSGSVSFSAIISKPAQVSSVNNVV
jgi:RNase P protein component